MGLFDFIFGKNNPIKVVNNVKKAPQRYIHYGHIIMNKEDVTPDNYDNLCNSFIAFDTETTGLSPENDIIIEVGAVRFVNGKPVEEYGSLINEGIPVPNAAYQVNHISTQMLREHGKSPEIAYKELSDFLGNALSGQVCILAHNATFDMAFLAKALERFGYNGTIRYLDTLSLSRQVLRGLPNYKQDTVASVFGIKNQNSHRAVSDAETCGRIAINLLTYKKDYFEKEKIKAEKSKPTAEEREIFAIIAKAMKKNGCDIDNLRAYRNTSNYVNMLDVYTILKFKLAKTKSYIVVPKLYTTGLKNVEPCTNTEGVTNARIIFNDPFELDEYGPLFSKLYSDMKSSQGIYMNQYEVEFLAQANLTGFKDSEIEEYIKCARNKQRISAELQEQKLRQEKETAALIQAKKEEKARLEQDAVIKKQQKQIAQLEQQKEIQRLLESSEYLSKEAVTKLTRLSAEKGKRAILQLDDDGHILRIYESIADASRSVGISPKTIRDVANGKYKHGGGFCWIYADEVTT